MSLFGDNTMLVVAKSIQRAFVLKEEDRQNYATQLIDTYQGFGMKYVERAIESSLKSPIVKTAMKSIMVCYPLLQNFIDEISMVYRVQPERKFYIDGKQIISEKPEESYVDTSKFEINKELYEKLETIYNRQFCLKIKEAEQLTNLLNTTVYKINNREGRIKMDFIPNDACVAVANKDDSTMMDRFKFAKNTSINKYNKVEQEWEDWGIETWKSSVFTGEKPNRAYEAFKDWSRNKDAVHIGSGFAPFAVLRSELSEIDFWDIKDQDVYLTILQINLAFTELRYLQRFGAFGLKYGVNVKLPDGATTDPIGFWELQSAQTGGHQEKMDFEVGELKNDARIKELIDSIFEMIKFLYDLFGIDSNRLVTSRQATTAESKKMDKDSIREFIEKQQEIWALNEETIFETVVSVYNRDNSDKIPEGIELRVDFYDSDDNAEEVQKAIENWMMRIENNVATYIDWIRDDNPDLNAKEAKQLHEENMAINASSKTQEMDTGLGEEQGEEVKDGENVDGTKGQQENMEQDR